MELFGQGRYKDTLFGLNRIKKEAASTETLAPKGGGDLPGTLAESKGRLESAEQPWILMCFDSKLSDGTMTRWDNDGRQEQL